MNASISQLIFIIMMLRFHTIATLASIAVVAAAVSSSASTGGDDSDSGLTFFDRNFGFPNIVASASAVITTRNEQQQQQANTSSNITTITSSSSATTTNNNNNNTNSNSKSPTKSATTPTPSLQQQLQQSQSLPPSSLASMPALCEHQPWAEICKPWFVNSTSAITTITSTTTDSPTTTTAMPTFYPSTMAPTTYEPTTYAPTTFAPTTDQPTLTPTVSFTLISEIAILESEDVDGGNGNAGNNTGSSNTTNANDGNSTANDGNATSTNNSTSGNNTSSSSNATTNTTDGDGSGYLVNVSYSYKLTPMDDTFLEVYRPKEPLGTKTKLKADAEQEWIEDDDTLAADNAARVPTKFIQLKFGLRTVLEEMRNVKWISPLTSDTFKLQLKSAKLHLFALSSSSFGGYVTAVLPSSENPEVGGGGVIAEGWDEESAVWSDYVKGAGGPGGGPGGGGGRGGKKILPSDKNPELSHISGPVVANKWYMADVSNAILDMMKLYDEEMADVDDDDDDDAAIVGPKKEDFVMKTKSLTLRISTNSTDGIIYASKEHPSGHGPYLELEFVGLNTREFTSEPSGPCGLPLSMCTDRPSTTSSTSSKPSMSPSATTIPVKNQTVKPEQENETTDLTPIEENSTVSGENCFINCQIFLLTSHTLTWILPFTSLLSIPRSNESVVNSTSVVSSSFRMTITAIESIGGRRNLASLLRTRGRVLKRESESSSTMESQQQLPQPTLLQKEEPSIMEHLSRVYNEVLTIAPIDISLVYEEDLEVEYMSADAKQDAGGVIRTLVFRVMGELCRSYILMFGNSNAVYKPSSPSSNLNWCALDFIHTVSAVFDQPEVSSMLSNDAAKVLDEATIYAFVGPEEEEFVKVFKNTGDPIVAGADTAEYDVTVLKVKYSKEDKEDVSSTSANREESNSDANQDSTSSSNAWLHPTLIAGASAICLASSAAAILLWRQRRSGEYYSDNYHTKANDSPRSFGEATVPTTPSPTGFLLASFKSKKRFDYSEFDDDGMDAENPLLNDGVVSPMSATNDNVHEQPITTTSDAHHPQPTNNIKFPDAQNVSFDDSSVSDVSAHVLGAKGNHRRIDHYGTQAESLLLDQSMDSGYNMETMSALEQVRFENVLDVDGYSLTSSKQRTNGVAGGGIRKVASEDTYGEDGSLSTGAVPSEMYSQVSMDDSLVYSHDNNSTAGGGDGEAVAYAGHLFTLDMLRNKDKSLLVMPPPPSDIASDTSSQKDDLEEDYDIVENNIGIEYAPMREKDEQESVSQSITDELTKVMQLLRSDDQSAGYTSMDESVMHIGTVAGHHTVAEEDVPPAASSDDIEPPAAVDNACYDGLNVLMNDGPIVDDGDGDNDVNEDPNDNTNHYLTEMNEAVSDCMHILDKAQMQNRQSSSICDEAISDKEVAVGTTVTVAAVDDESSLVTQTLD